MAGFIGQWGPRQEQLHPRGFHGRWIKKFSVPSLLPRVLAKMDQIFHPRTFQSDGQAAQFLHNKAAPTRFKNGADHRRMMVDWDEANAGLQSGTITPSTQRYIDMMEENQVTLEDDLILTQVFTPEALGFTPQQMAEEHGDFDGLLGAVVADKGYSATHIGTSPQMGPGKIQMAIATPKGTKVIIPGRANNDRAVFLDRDQNLLITRVDRNPTTGEYYMMAVVMPKQKNEPNVPNLEAPRGAGFTDEQREARIGQPAAPNDQEARAGQRPPMGAGGQVTPEDAARVAESPSAQTPPPQAAPQPAPAPTSPVQGQGPAPRNEPIHRQSVGGTGGADGRAPEEIAATPPEAAPETPAPQAPVALPSPQEEHLSRARQRAQAKRGYRQMASAIPVADALQTVEELRHQKQDPKVIAQHIRGITTDPSMEEVPADRRQALTDQLNGAADLFEQGKANQGAARLSSAARELDLETGDKPGSTVDYDPATMDSVSDVADGQQVEVLRPPVTHVDPDTGKSTVVSKGRVRPVGGAPEGGAPEPVPTGIVETSEAPLPPVKATKKAAGAKFTPDQERRLIDRAAQWRGQERNDEERRIVAEADKILARRGQQAAPTPVREPRQGRAPMAKKAAAKAAPAPAKKAAPTKLTGDRKPSTHQGSNIIRDANQDLADGRDPGQVAEEMREKADALLAHGEPLGTDDLVNPGRTEHSDEDLRDIARGDVSLIDRMADDLEKEAKAAPVKKRIESQRKAEATRQARAKESPEEQMARTRAAMEQKAERERKAAAKKAAAPKKATDILAEQEAKKLERAKAQHAKDEAAKAKAAERARVAEEKKAAAAKAKEERAAAKAAGPAKVAKKAAPAKDLTPEQRAAAEVQARADEAGLPNTVADLRAAAKEQGIRGFSTMRKEQLQRALLGEEVSTGTTKLQVVSPEKMVGHLERVDTDSAARTLLDKHTLKDLKALADKLEIDHKERKLTTKDKLKNAILEKVRGTPGTDFEPISPDEAVSIRDINVPDGPDGDMLRRGLVEVDDTDPASLRDESERLESHATQLRQRGDRVNAGLYQEASDRMGMRAQQISGMEEVPKPAKRAPRKAAAPKKRTAAEVRALIGPKLTDELLQAAGDHERQRKDALRLMEGLAKANPDSGVGRVAKKAAADLRGEAPAAAPAKKAAKAAVPKATPLSTQDFLKRYHITSEHPDFRNPPSRDEVEAQLAPMRRAQLVEIAKELKVPGASSKTMPELRGDIREATVGHRLDSIATRGFRGATPFTDEVPSSRPAEEVARATERATKTVAPGSVPGARAQAPISNPERARSFMDSMAEAGLPDRGARPAQVSIDEVARNISEGHYSPEEGIRRLETDIDLNKLDLAEMEAQLRGDLTVQDRASIRKEHGLLKEDIVVQEKAVKFIRGHVRKEPEITPAEAKAALDPEQQSWLQRATPDDIREAARQNGLGEVDGDTAEEIWDNAVKKVVEREMASREAKKAAAAKKAAKKALPKAEPKLDPDNPDRLDVRQIGIGIDFKDEDSKMLDDIQQRLDAGESPASIGKDWGEQNRAFSPRTQRAMMLGVADIDSRIADAKEQKLPPDRIKQLEDHKATLQADAARLTAQAERQEELGRRLQAMRRPAKKAAPSAPEAPATISTTAPVRLRPKEIKVGDTIEGGQFLAGRKNDPSRPSAVVARIEKSNTGRFELYDDKGDLIQSVNPNSYVWRRAEGTSAPEAPAPTKARRVGPGGSSFPADMPAEERARRVAQIEKRQAPAKAAPAKRTKWEVSRNKSVGVNNYASEAGLITEFVPDKRGEPRAYRAYKPNEGGKANFTSLQAAKDWLEGRDTETPGEFEPGQAVPEVQAAKKETAVVQARLLTTAMERLEVARTEAQVREAVKGLTMPELKVVAGKYPLTGVGRSKESITKALVDFHTNRANFEVLTRGGMRDNPIEAGNFSDAPTIPNTWGTGSGDVSFHPDGPVGQALAGLGPDAKLNVDGDSLENAVGKLATRSARGQISADQFIEELKRLDARLPPGRAKQRLASVIAEIDTPKREPLPLPEGTPAPLVELMQMFSGMPLARQTPRAGKQPAMDELKSIAEEFGQRPSGRLIMELRTRLHNNIHESYGAEGAFELDRAVLRAIEQLREAGRRPS